LNLNYRSTPQILGACQNLIRHNVETPVKKFTKNIGIEFYHSDL
jgi:superfamily I DNA/RNA helicase